MIAIIDYEAGNLKSVERALESLGHPCRITSHRREILGSERIIFPGVGAAGKAVRDLRRTGLDLALIEAFARGKPILGICLGAQIILDRSEENQIRCLGLIGGEVKRFPSPLLSDDNQRLKIPHMGWNDVEIAKRHPIMEGIMPRDEFYFVHSYYPLPNSADSIIGTTEYGIKFAAVIGFRNLIATQFHPEKSGRAGLRILKNFCSWDGRYVE
ncbi:MAG: imidazole glycerol phosphate synthase subunit HisH [Pseudomonadota bacterium]